MRKSSERDEKVNFLYAFTTACALSPSHPGISLTHSCTLIQWNMRHSFADDLLNLISFYCVCRILNDSWPCGTVPHTHTKNHTHTRGTWLWTGSTIKVAARFILLRLQCLNNNRLKATTTKRKEIVKRKVFCICCCKCVYVCVWGEANVQKRANDLSIPWPLLFVSIPLRCRF